MTTIIQTTDTNVTTSPVISLTTGDYFYQFAGVGLSTTDTNGPAISASGSNDTVEIHGSVFSPSVAVGGPITSFIVASTGSVSGGSTGLQALFTSSQSHYTIDGSVTGGTFGIDSSGSPLYLHVGSTGSVTGLLSDAINLSQTLFGVIDGSVSGVLGIRDAATSGGFELTVSQGGKVTGTSSYGVSFNNDGNVVVDGQVVGGNGMASNTAGQVAIRVGTTGSVAGTFGDGIDVSAQSAVVVVNGEATGAGNGISAGQTMGTTNIMVGAAGFVSGFQGIDVENAGTIGVAGTVTGTGFWGISTGNFNQPSEIYVYAGGLVTGGGATGGGIRVRGSHQITNDGTVSSTDNAAVFADGAGILLNTGRITGGPVGVSYVDANTNDVMTTVNTGSISGTPNPLVVSGPNFVAYDGASNDGTDHFINQGSVIGDIRLGTHDGSNFVNAGTVTGNVFLGNGVGQLANSTFGTVSGVIVAGTGGDTIVAGQTGGNVIGGVGDDMLYANQTQAAADNRAHTTLDGRAGTNALYGGGGFNTFLAGDANGGYNQVWGGASAMTGVSGYTNNTISYDNVLPGNSVYVDLLNGHDGFVNSGPNQSGTYTYEDSIINVPNVVGSSSGDIILADNGTDRIQGGAGADALYAGSGGSSQDTFAYTGYADSNLNSGYDTIVGFKLGTDLIDLSALHTDGSHLAISTAGTANTLYVEQTPGTFNASTDLAMIVNTTTPGGLNASNFVF